MKNNVQVTFKLFIVHAYRTTTGYTRFCWQNVKKKTTYLFKNFESSSEALLSSIKYSTLNTGCYAKYAWINSLPDAVTSNKVNFITSYGVLNLPSYICIDFWKCSKINLIFFRRSVFGYISIKFYCIQNFQFSLRYNYFAEYIILRNT